MVALLFIGNFRRWKTFWAKLAIHFLPLYLLHCYSHLASKFCFVPDRSVKQLIMKSLRYSKKKQTHVKIVVPKLQETVMYGNRRDSQLQPCILHSVPFSPLLPRMVSVVTMLKNTAPQSLSLPTGVNFVIKTLQDFTLHDTKKTPNMAFLSVKLMISISNNSCDHVNKSWWIPNLKVRDTKFSITQWKIST